MLLKAAVFLWGGAYVLFSLRALSLGLGHPLEQALIRAAAMGAGLGLSGIIYRLAVRTQEASIVGRVLLLSVAVIASGILYALLNYLLAYVLLDLWKQSQPTLTLLFLYFMGVVWIFAIWVLIVLMLRWRIRTERGPADADKRSEEEGVWIRRQNGRVRISFEDMRWIEAEGDYVRIHLAERSYLHRATMDGLEKLLRPHGIVRIHRRYLVRNSALASMVRLANGTRYAVLNDQTRLPIGRRFLSRLKLLQTKAKPPDTL